MARLASNLNAYSLAVMQRDHAEVVGNDLRGAGQDFGEGEPSHALAFMKHKGLGCVLGRLDAEEDPARAPAFEPALERATQERYTLADRELELLPKLAPHGVLGTLARVARTAKQAPPVGIGYIAAIFTVLQQISAIGSEDKRCHTVEIEALDRWRLAFDLESGIEKLRDHLVWFGWVRGRAARDRDRVAKTPSISAASSKLVAPPARFARLRAGPWTCQTIVPIY